MSHIKVSVQETKPEERIQVEDLKYFSTASLTINPNWVNPKEEDVKKFKHAALHFFLPDVITEYLTMPENVEKMEIGFQLEVGEKYSRTHIQVAINLTTKYGTTTKFDREKMENYWNNILEKHFNEKTRKIHIDIKMSTDLARYMAQYVKKVKK